MKALLIVVCIFTCTVVLYNTNFAQANQSLSNLTATAVNTSLIPGTDGSIDLGSKNFTWKNLYLKTGIFLKGKQSFQSPGTGNFFVGGNAGNATLSGKNNIAFGIFAASKLAAANYNTVVGDSSLYNDTTGFNNSAFGFKSLFQNITGSYNTGVGFDALFTNRYGSANTSMGMYSLYNCTGSYNTAVGYSALGQNTSGLYNCGFGQNVLNTTQTGIENSGFGYGADVTASNISNATVIGYNAVCDASNKVRVGNTGVTSIGGQVGWTTFSDGRFKKNIQENVAGLAFINMLRPITYTVDISALNKHYGKTSDNINADKITYTGFIAQEVEAAAQKINYNFSGVDKPSTPTGLYGLRYDNFVVPLVKAVQELSKMNDDKDAKLADMQKQIDDLKAIVQNLAQNNNAVSSNATSNTMAASLGQNIPNPVSKSTIINYTLPQNFIKAQIIIADENGKVLQQKIISGPGKGIVNINASTLSSGAYNYSLYVDGKIIASKQMMVVR